MRRFALVLAVALAGFASSGAARSSALTSIEGRWTLSTGEYLPGSIPPDLVISVDDGKVYGMLGDFQIRGAVRDGIFAFNADWPQHPLTVNGSLQADGTLGGRLSLASSPAHDGSRLRKNTSWTASRAPRR